MKKSSLSMRWLWGVNRYYERIPDEVRDLDAKFKALTAQLVDHLRQNVIADA